MKSYPIILQLLLLKGYTSESINEAVQTNTTELETSDFLWQYLDSVEKSLYSKLEVLVTDETSFLQWFEYLKQCKAAGQTPEQMLEVLREYIPDKILVEEDGKLHMPESEQVQQEPTVVIQEQVQHESKSEYNFDYDHKKELAIRIRETQQIITDEVYKLSLLKDQTKQGPYMNEGHLDCPSYKNLIEPIRNAIVEKRKLSISKYWYEKYRPEVIEEIIFPNKVLKETIEEYVFNKRIAGHCMFYGTGGVGKTTVNTVLLNNILESPADRFILGRKVDDVDNLKGWLNAKAIGGQRIVVIEEFDRLSNQAQTEIKNGLMEKYTNVVFLASTNNIHKIDSALLSRFTLVSKFDIAPIEEIIKKCTSILTNERISFTDEDVRIFAEANKLKGLRTIINNLQLSCYNNVFDPNRTSFFIGNSGAEYDMIQNIKWYISAIVSYDKPSLIQLSYNLNVIPDIAKVRANITYILQSNYSLNLEYIYMELLNDNIFLPVKNLIQDYYQDSELKKLPTMHFEAMLNDIIMEVIKTKDIYLG